MTISIYQKDFDTHLDYVINKIKEGESLRHLCNELDINYGAFYAKIKSIDPTLISRSKSKTIRKRLSESKFSDISKETLEDLYFVKEMTYSEISKELNIAKGTITNLFKRYGLSPKKMSEYTDKIWTQEKREEQRKKCYNGEIGIHSQGDGAYRFTKPERDFCNWCDDNDIEYERQFQIRANTHRYDFLLKGTNILVEIDGEFWHSTDEQKAKDLKFEEYASENGFCVVRFTDREMAQTKMKCFEVLYDSI